MLQHAHLSRPGCSCPVLSRASEQREESLHLSSRGRRPAGTRAFSDPECGLLTGCRVVPKERSISSPCLLTCKAGLLNFTRVYQVGLRWIPAQAEWNRFGLCTEDCQARGQAAQPHHNCAPSQGCPKLHTRGAHLRLHLWVWTLNTETAASRVPDRMAHLVSRCGAFTQPGESDFGTIRSPQMRNPATVRARNSPRSHKEQAEGNACHLSHCPSCHDLG